MNKHEIRRASLKRLVESLGHGGITLVSSKTGIDPSYVSRMLYPPEKSGAKNIGEELADKLAAAFPDWFATGDGQMLLATSNANLKSELDELVIPHYDTGGKMGNGGLVLRDQPGTIKGWRVSEDWVSKNAKNFTAAKNLCIVTGFGDSMQPMFNSGDPVLVDSGVTSVEFDSVYFFRVDGEGFIKRLQRIPGIGLRAISENKAYESWDIKPEMDFEVFGRVIRAWAGEDF